MFELLKGSLSDKLWRAALLCCALATALEGSTFALLDHVNLRHRAANDALALAQSLSTRSASAVDSHDWGTARQIWHGIQGVLRRDTRFEVHQVHQVHLPS